MYLEEFLGQGGESFGLLVEYLILQPKRILLVFLTRPRYCCYPSSQRWCISGCHIFVLKYFSENLR